MRMKVRINFYGLILISNRGQTKTTDSFGEHMHEGLVEPSGIEAAKE